MPRLGGSAEDEDVELLHRRVHNAYQGAHGEGLRWATIIALLVGGFILRNILFHDYRGDLIDRLKEGGRTQEEIDRWFPQTFDERQKTQKKAKDTVDNLFKEVAALRVEVDEIKKKLDPTQPKE